MSAKAQKFWDRQAARYDSGEVQFEPVYKEILAKMERHLASSHLVLDLGCATGTKTIQLATLAGHVHGIDLSAGMIAEAVKKKEATGATNVSFTQGTIFGEELNDRSFDRIISFGVIHLLEEPERVTRRVNELLRPGGLFISTTPCFKEKMAVRTRLQVSMILAAKALGVFPLHLNRFRAGDMEALMEGQKFRVVEAEKIFDGMTISYMVAQKK